MSPLILGSVLLSTAVAAWTYMFMSRPVSTTRNTATAAPSSRRGNSQVGSAPVNLHEALLARSRSERVVKPWLRRLSSTWEFASSQSRVQQLSDLAATAGLAQVWTARRIAFTRWTLTFIGVGLGLVCFRILGGVYGMVFGIVVAAIGYRAVDTYLINRARVRQEAITRELPDIADQIAINVQAGLSFEHAVARTVSSMQGPLTDELGRYLHDLRVGQSSAEAFRNLQERVDLPDMTTFIRAAAHAERTGVSVAAIMQIQADELREKRRQRAEERAMKLPVLVLVPLVTCVLPPLLIVLLGPAMIQLLHQGLGA